MADGLQEGAAATPHIPFTAESAKVEATSVSGRIQTGSSAQAAIAAAASSSPSSASAIAHSTRALATRIGQKLRLRGSSLARTTSDAFSIVSAGRRSCAHVPDAKNRALASSIV